ncbi:MAG: class I SAM-dependent methyltransferase [Planctomycetota bacterium]|nr:class I SAM-dependent methyltransferase [Planctomycetota bacterium]
MTEMISRYPLVIMGAVCAMYWALVTEFSYLGAAGRMCMRFTYSISASVYDHKWKSNAYKSSKITNELFLNPLKESLPATDAKMLDLACGTGRMSLMALREEWFHGSIEAIDFSTGMLRKFQRKLDDFDEGQRNRVSMACQDLADWQPDDNAYDAITMMEVSQFLPDLEDVVRKVYKALRPGGLFLLTRAAGVYSYALPHRNQSRDGMDSLLNRAGFRDIKIRKWESRHDAVSAWKAESETADV